MYFPLLKPHGQEKDPLLSRRRLIQRFLWPWEIPVSYERRP